MTWDNTTQSAVVFSHIKILIHVNSINWTTLKHHYHKPVSSTSFRTSVQGVVIQQLLFTIIMIICMVYDTLGKTQATVVKLQLLVPVLFLETTGTILQ